MRIEFNFQFDPGPHSMLFVVVIRNRYWSCTHKIVKLVFYAHSDRTIIPNIR